MLCEIKPFDSQKTKNVVVNYFFFSTKRRFIPSFQTDCHHSLEDHLEEDEEEQEDSSSSSSSTTELATFYFING